MKDVIVVFRFALSLVGSDVKSRFFFNLVSAGQTIHTPGNLIFFQ